MFFKMHYVYGITFVCISRCNFVNVRLQTFSWIKSVDPLVFSFGVQIKKC